MTRIAGLIILFVWIIGNLSAQVPSCCAPQDPTLAFADFGKQQAFRSAHEAPLPLQFDSKKGKDITFPVADGKPAHAWEVKSANPSNNYLFVIHEWWGLNDYIKREAERLANDLGDINVLALDLYDYKVADNADSASAFMQAVNKDRAAGIIKGALKFAGKNASVYTIGWCFGGGWSLQASLLAGKQGKGCVMYYGMPEKDVARLRNINAPVYGIFASRDQWINETVVEEFEASMKKAGKKLTTKTYDAEHAFANPSNPHYDQKSAGDAYARVLDFLRKQMK